MNFFALLLWAGAVLALIAGMPQLTVAIAAVVVLNAIFAFIQEQRADRAAAQLISLLPSDVTVVRDARRVKVRSEEVVVGDLVSLGPGDRIPADGEVVSAHDLQLDTSMLTGESQAVAIKVSERIFAGSFVTQGDALMSTSGIGDSTRLAEISRLSTGITALRTPMDRELRRIVRWVTVIALGVGLAFFAITVVIGNPLQEAFVFGIGVAVALVPEALLPTVTLTLALGAERMARRQVLIRNLEAVETLGSTTIICTDKTGTLTMNEMTVVRAWTPTAHVEIEGAGYSGSPLLPIDPPTSADAIRSLAESGVLSSEGYVYEDDKGWHACGDPMEAALDAFARRCGVDTDKLRERTQGLRKFPFDPRRRRMSVLLGSTLIVKGAPDSILPLADHDERATQVLAEMTADGLRVLAIAERVDVQDAGADALTLESGLSLLGFVALEDPPRPDVHASLEACVAAGICVIMVTGDHPGTATAIADQIGLRSPAGRVLIGSELPPEDSLLADAIVEHGTVIARVSPEEKLRIAQCLRASGHVVAMTGDGVNDVPALHAADIGIAMGRSGSDIARESADMVLLDDHFASIVAGIEQGRTTFLNVRHFLTYHLTDNVAELMPFVIWAVSGGQFPLALGVLQILALDIGTDTLSAVALGSDPPARNVLSRADHRPPDEQACPAARLRHSRAERGCDVDAGLHLEPACTGMATGTGGGRNVGASRLLGRGIPYRRARTGG